VAYKFDPSIFRGHTKTGCDLEIGGLFPPSSLSLLVPLFSSLALTQRFLGDTDRKEEAKITQATDVYKLDNFPSLKTWRNQIVQENPDATVFSVLTGTFWYKQWLSSG
jgi:hypothetical protein